jgi:hypothetical protein
MSDDDSSSTVSVRLQGTLFEGTYTYIASVVTVTWPGPTGGVVRATGFAVTNPGPVAEALLCQLVQHSK